ncbi:Formate hydrogenlyase, membrane subunit HyfB [Nitrospira sp. KM1]|uniref:hydrogenase 4 subunit B n=1 Tax=Nitrospira sp. KM1 TaxID=1936990 RepID=UPI0013A71C2D|nr:hydrogenase 4 subunit B [Nitrospira sp. KM1]BCA56002.1 Formate hydrogenlyase, membrane subunit HyfB [Nitrospira sp. KM1]
MAILLFLTLVGYAAGLLLPLCVPARPKVQNILAHGLAGVAAVGGCCLGITGLLAAKPFEMSVPSTLPLLTFAIRLDPLASFFLLTISLVSLAASIYALGYVTKFYGRVSMSLLGSLFNGFLLSMTLVVIADNGFFFLIVWELMSLISYFLVVTEHEKSDVRYAGLFYLIMTHVGTAFILLTFLLLFQESGSFSFDAFRQPEQSLPDGMKTMVFLTALIGFGTKAGFVPLHVWLPYAHPAAPSHISALMSGVMIKTAIYALVRVCFDFFGGYFPWWWGFVVLAIGAVSAVLGVMYALMEHDLKSLLAYHSVENIGIILLGIGAGMIFHSYGFEELAALGLIAGLYHTINHAIFKALLFFGAGSLLYATHTRNMEEYGGLLRRMPWTGACFLIGAVSIAALPPTNGFISEWLVFQSLFLSYEIPSLFMKLMLPIAAAMLALTGVLALTCFAKAFGISFLALPRSSHAKHAEEVPWPMRIGMGFLAAGCVALGLAPMLAVPIMDRVTASMIGASISEKMLALGGWALTPVNVEFSSISSPVLGLVLAATAAFGLALVALHGGTRAYRYGKTWACGLNVTPRMEYSATGFVQPIKRVFSTIYQPTVKLETDFLEESRYFAKRRRFEFHIEPVFQKYLYDSVVTFMSGLAHRLRIVQAGSLHLYLAYMFVTLVMLLLLAL